VLATGKRHHCELLQICFTTALVAVQELHIIYIILYYYDTDLYQNRFCAKAAVMVVLQRGRDYPRRRSVCHRLPHLLLLLLCATSA